VGPPLLHRTLLALSITAPLSSVAERIKDTDAGKKTMQSEDKYPCDQLLIEKTESDFRKVAATHIFNAESTQEN